MCSDTYISCESSHTWIPFKDADSMVSIEVACSKAIVHIHLVPKMNLVSTVIILMINQSCNVYTKLVQKECGPNLLAQILCGKNFSWHTVNSS